MPRKRRSALLKQLKLTNPGIQVWQCAWPVISLVHDNAPSWLGDLNTGVNYLYNLIGPSGRL